MKHDRREVLSFGKDVDVMKGNDEHVYIYVGGEKGEFFQGLDDSAGVSRGCVQQGTFGTGNGKRTMADGHSAEGEVTKGDIRKGRW